MKVRIIIKYFVDDMKNLGLSKDQLRCDCGSLITRVTEVLIEEDSKIKRSLWIFAIIVSAITFAAGYAFAQTDKEIEEMKGQIEVLTEEIEKIKLGAVAEPKYERYVGLGPAASKVYRVERGLSLAGYGELLYENYDKKRDDGTEASQRDQFDALRGVLYVGYKFTDRIVFNSEFEFEHGRTGTATGVPQEKSGSVATEFMYIDFLLSEPMNLRAGMVLIPMGFLTELHEPPTFHGAVKPDVERIILPSIWRDNGAGIFGKPLPDVEYKFYLVSSLFAKGFSADKGIAGGRQQGTFSISEDFALTGRIDYRGIPGVIIGGAFFSGDTGQRQTHDLKATGNPLPGSQVNLWDIHTEMNIKALEIRGVYAQGTIGDVSRLNQALGVTGTKSIGEKFYGWYLDAGYDVLPYFVNSTTRALIPYIIYERYNTQEEVPSGYSADPANDRTTTTVGISYKPHSLVAIKGDYQDRKNEAGTAVDQFNIAVTFMF